MCLLLLEYPVPVREISLTVGAVQVKGAFTDFMPACFIADEGMLKLQLSLWVFLFLFSFLSVLASRILVLCSWVYTVLGSLCLLGELTTVSLYNVPLYP